jgi:iron complex transport system substrate-binding protein
VVSLDQCADQFVLAFAPRDQIAGVSHRVDDTDSELRALAPGLPRVRASAEAVLAARPTVVVRSWGGDARLLRLLERQGVRVVQVGEATTLSAVEANVRRIAAELGAPEAGAAKVEGMRVALQRSRGAWAGREGFYMTPGGVTAGRGTLIEAILAAAGLRNAAEGAGWRPVPAEALVLRPPSLMVLGFFDEIGRQRWSPGRSGVLRRISEQQAVARLPAARLGCPGWFAADAAETLARAAR